ncbi:MAG: MTH895/ArsE family thioredoxin-like protein [bacterium]|nr:MTH895/ArsE family thioredoxin-like protein [bacterium]
MNGKELVLAALRNQATARVPWVPFVGCHGAALLGVSARDYFLSADLIVRGAGAAIQRYQADGIPVTFDLQIEAETLGCDLVWADENPPAVASHPLLSRTLADLHVPRADEGRLPIVLEAARRLAAQQPETALYGLITGPFTLALHLLGPHVFMLMYDDPQKMREVLGFCRDVAVAVAGYYMDAGCDVIAMVDPMTSQIGPQHFREFVTPFVTPIFDVIRARGKLSSFFVCGHAQANIEEMCHTKPDNISIDENIQLGFVREMCARHGISFGGNLQLTVVLLFGKKEDCLRNAIECIGVGGGQGYVLAPGCDIPYATPPANLEVIGQLVRDPYQQDIARTLLQTRVETHSDLDLSDYGTLDKVVVDVITLDSEACAPCQYMVEAVRNVAPLFEDLIIWREHKIKIPESVEFMAAMMVRNVPTICIDGEIVFVSRIPSRDELVRAIQERLNRKVRRYFKQYTGKVLVLGGGCAACDETKDNIAQAIKELGIAVPVECVTDAAEIARYEVDATPAVITVQTVVKSVGKVPAVDVIKEWLKDLRL